MHLTSVLHYLLELCLEYSLPSMLPLKTLVSQLLLPPLITDLPLPILRLLQRKDLFLWSLLVGRGDVVVFI